MIHNLWYGNNSLLNIGFTLKEAPFYVSTERSIELVETEGADGDTIKDNGRYRNYPLDFEINSIPFFTQGKTNEELFCELKDWLFAFGGDYKKLVTSTHPGYFRYALAMQPEKITTLPNGALDTTIHFTVKPYFYSEKGTKRHVFSNSGTTFSAELFNPESYDSETYIKVITEGAFKLTVGDISMKATECSGYLEFDSKIKHVHKGKTEMDDVVSGDYMPVFKKGLNTIVVESQSSNDITGVEIIPRWRRL